MALNRTRAIRWILDDRQLGMSEAGNLIQGDVQVTTPAVDAAIGIETELTNVRRITIQLYNWQRVAIDKETPFEIFCYASPAMAAMSPGGSTGIGSTTHLCATVIPKLRFMCASDIAGFWQGTWTDIGTDPVCLGIQLPNGRTVLSSQFSNT
jgi:hypothetical protein